MKPSRKLAETSLSDRDRLTLVEHDKSYCIRLNGADLMHSRTSASELLLGEVGCSGLSGLAKSSKPRVLIGGLGLGFTLKSVLDNCGSHVRVEVAELLSEVIEWNRRLLHDLNGRLLDDPRVSVHTEDVSQTIRRAGPNSYDVILLDIDNGPAAMVQKSNEQLYDRRGLSILATAIKPGGRLAVWSAARDGSFEKRLRQVGFRVEALPARTHPNAKRSAYTIYLADR